MVCLERGRSKPDKLERWAAARLGNAPEEQRSACKFLKAAVLLPVPAGGAGGGSDLGLRIVRFGYPE